MDFDTDLVSLFTEETITDRSLVQIVDLLVACLANRIYAKSVKNTQFNFSPLTIVAIPYLDELHRSKIFLSDSEVNL